VTGSPRHVSLIRMSVAKCQCHQLACNISVSPNIRKFNINPFFIPRDLHFHAGELQTYKKRGHCIIASLVGGSNIFLFPQCVYIYGIIIPTDFHIFQRGRSTTNQIIFFCPGWPVFKKKNGAGMVVPCDPKANATFWRDGLLSQWVLLWFPKKATRYDMSLFVWKCCCSPKPRDYHES
jgi:hypothetical protein